MRSHACGAVSAGFWIVLVCAIGCTDADRVPQQEDGRPLPLTPARPPVAYDQLETDGALAVESTVLQPRKSIPIQYTEYGDGISPPLSWSGVPQGTRSLVLILEDPIDGQRESFVHWVLFNIPAEAAELPEGVPDEENLGLIPGSLQGRNSAGTIGYFGPKPPAGDPHHEYHFQVFALDTELELDAGSERDLVVRGMQDHVLAKGRLIAVFEHPETLQGSSQR